jgi:diphthamide synthase (EF-2-diphthine--ammonia ligase)
MATITVIDPNQLEPTFAGRSYDAAFLDDLPESVDPCGEQGEFHTVVTDGPMFGSAIPVTVGNVVEREGFVFADVDVSTEAHTTTDRDTP